MDGYTELSSSSIYSSLSYSTRTTAPGLGYLSGRFIKRLGESVLNGVDNVFVNRQLSRIKASVKTDNAWHEDTLSPELQEMCGILLELSRAGYPFSTRTRALRIIMALVGSMNFVALATSLVDLNSTSTIQRHLCDVLDCLWDSKLSENAFKREAGDEATRKKILMLRSTGYDSYIASSPPPHSSILLVSSPLVLYLTLIAVLGEAKHSRLILSGDLDILRFLRFIGLFDKDRGGTGIMAGRLLMHVLQVRLSPGSDDRLNVAIKDAISELRCSPGAGDSVMEYMWARFEQGSTESLSRGFLLNAVTIIQHQLITNETRIAPDPSGDSPTLRDVKVLLLGTGCSGKTTIMKHLILVHKGFSFFTAFYEPRHYLEMMENQIYNVLKEILDNFPANHVDSSWAYFDRVGIVQHQFNTYLIPPQSDSKSFCGRQERLLRLHDFVQTHIKSFTSLRSALSRDLNLPDTIDQLGLLLEALHGMVDRFRKRDNSASALIDMPQLKPIPQDLLGWYVKTTGVHRESFITQDGSYIFWDCGGQRSERNKWGHYLPLTDVVVFVVSLIEYDRVLVEDHSTNAMDESLGLFKSICTTSTTEMKQLKRLPLTLVFNQMDRLQEKLETSPLQDHFPEYDGGSDMNAACEYIKNRFLEYVPQEMNVSVHFMSALDPRDVEDLFREVQKQSIVHTFEKKPLNRPSRTSIVLAS